jgi:uncharacterized protein YecE (DUF72 family)
MQKNNVIHIGTSGWHYVHWRNVFYPKQMAADNFLVYYQDRFHCVEINHSFYRLPSEKTLKNWRNSVASEFIFAVKASRYITHMKKLKDPQQTRAPLLERIQILEDRLGPVLFQLPPRWHYNGPRLKAFLEALPEGFRYAMEFRDPDWLNAEAFDMLRHHGIAFCIYEFGGRLSPKAITADFVYVRLHGPKGAYEGNYDAQTLSEWAGAISTWARSGRDVFCFFDNDQAGYAARNALSLQKMLS